MLTPTQRAWAEAQVGTPRTAILDGTGFTAAPGAAPGTYVVQARNPDGQAGVQMQTTRHVAEQHIGKPMDVRIAGTVVSVEYDEDGGRVGLVVSGSGGQVTQWVVPERSAEEKAQIETERAQARQAAEQAAEEARAAAESEAVRLRVLGLLSTDDAMLVDGFKSAFLAWLDGDPQFTADVKVRLGITATQEG